MESDSEKTVSKKDKSGELESTDNDGQKRTRPKKILVAIFVIGIIAGSFFGIRWLQYYLTHASTDDARVKGDLIAVSPIVQGKIRFIPIREGEHVVKGQLIAQLLEEDYQAKVDVAAGVFQAIEAELKEAQANLTLVREKTQKEVKRATAVLSASQARLNEAKAGLRLASLDMDRISKLYRSKTVSESEMDKTMVAYDLALARVALAEEEIEENQAKLEVAEANTGEVAMKQGRVEALNGRLEEAGASLELTKLKLAYTKITSPIDGVVAKKVAKLGEVIKLGQPVAIIVDLDNVWIEANLEETKVEYVRLGQVVDLKADAYPKTKFTGKVVNIGAAASSEFALIPENRSAGSFTKVTQRIPIRIEVIDSTRQLRPGMMVVVGIDIRDAKNSGKSWAKDSMKK